MAYRIEGLQFAFCEMSNPSKLTAEDFAGWHSPSQSFEPISLGSMMAVKGSSSNWTEIFTTLPNNRILRIWFLYTNDGYKSLIDQILSTFKFLDQNQQTDNSSSCVNDSDCALAIANSWSDCSLIDTCEPIDYSLGKWIAVNQAWFSQQVQKCAPEVKACNPKPLNDKFSAVCSNLVCKKMASKL